MTGEMWISVLVCSILGGVIGAFGIFVYYRRRVDRLDLEVHRLGGEVNRLEEVAYRDSLTGVLNRRAWDRRAEDKSSRAIEGEQRGLLMLDVDNFKAINDTLGHAAGDDTLRAIGRILMALKRPYDSVFRYGGEEFAIELYAVDEGGVLAAAERIRAALDREIEVHVGDETVMLKVTVSIGVAVLIQPLDRLDFEIGMADVALYEAKRLGKNRVEVAPHQKGTDEKTT